MSPEAYAALTAGLRANAYTRGNILFYQGNEPFALFFVCSGRVKLTQTEREGRRILRVISGPDFVGERALVSGQPYGATAEVMDAARICVVEAGRFRRFWERDAELARAMARHLADKLGESNAFATELALTTIRQRLARFVLQEAEASGRPLERFRLLESRQELAELLATSPEVVSRALKELMRRGLVALEGPLVRVLDLARLRAVAKLPGRPLDFYQAAPIQASTRRMGSFIHNGLTNGYSNGHR